MAQFVEAVNNRVKVAVAHFTTLTGAAPNEKELRMIVNRIVYAVNDLPMPKQEFPRGRGFKHFREARDWRAAALRFYRKLTVYSNERKPSQTDPHTGTVLAMWGTTLERDHPYYGFRKDTEVVAVPKAGQFIDPNDGVPVVFGRNQWAHEACQSL